MRLQNKVTKKIRSERINHFSSKKSACFKGMADGRVQFFFEKWKSCETNIYLISLELLRLRFYAEEKGKKEMFKEKKKKFKLMAACYYDGKEPV